MFNVGYVGYLRTCPCFSYGDANRRQSNIFILVLRLCRKWNPSPSPITPYPSLSTCPVSHAVQMPLASLLVLQINSGFGGLTHPGNNMLRYLPGLFPQFIPICAGTWTDTIWEGLPPNSYFLIILKCLIASEIRRNGN